MTNVNLPGTIPEPPRVDLPENGPAQEELGANEKTVSFFEWFRSFFVSEQETKSLEDIQVTKGFGNDEIGALSGVVGNGEMFRKVRVTWINGIDHTSEDAIAVAKRISKAFGDVNVHYVCNETAGFWSDLAQASMQKIAGKVTPEVRALASHFKSLIQDLGGVDSGGKIMHLAHSQGAIITYLAKSYLTEAERKMIDVRTFGPAQVITSKDYSSAINYISAKDPLLYVNRDAIAVWRSGKPTSEIICMEPINSEGYIDHSMDGPTYKSALNLVAKDFKNEYETYSAKALRWIRDKWNTFKGEEPDILL